MNILWVMAGGAFGAGARYLAVNWASRSFGADYLGVALVNIVGSALIGLVVGAALSRGDASPKLLLFVVTGFLGGFTTFSTFSLDAFKLIESGRFGVAMLYMFGSLLAGLAAAALGVTAARAALS